MEKKKNPERICVEWEKRFDNIGVILPHPIEILTNWISTKDIISIIQSFWTSNIDKIFMLDLCALMAHWWEDKSIVAARYCFLINQDHHSSEYIFNKQDLRIVIKFRQPDIDGKHWKENHIHILRGGIDPNNCSKILKPVFNKHIPLYGPPIPGKYIIKV